MKQFAQVSSLPEGKVAVDWFRGRFNANKNILLLLIGATGSGKSWSCMRLCELWYKDYFKKEFPSEHIVFSLEEAGKLIFSGKLKRGDIIIIEEAGINMNALDFQKKAVKFFGFVLQSFRSKNIGIIFNTPNFSFIGKTQRTLLHGVFETAGIDMAHQQVIIKPYYLQTNSFMGKSYKKFLRKKINGRTVPIERIALGRPSDKLIQEYEAKKSAFVDKVGADFTQVTEQDNAEEHEETMKRFESYIERELTFVQIKKEEKPFNPLLGTRTCSRFLSEASKRRRERQKQAQSLGNVDFQAQNTVLAPSLLN